ncbi:MAG: L-aspartate oxidase [Desulfopila sp.]
MNSDFLIVGSGIAGLSFALRAAELGSVIIVTKKQEADGATNLAQGGIAAVLGEDDSFDLHIQDTLSAGAGLCDLDVVKKVIENGPARVKDLVGLGVAFNRDAHEASLGGLDLGREGGHSRRRVAHALDITGREIERALLLLARQHPNILLLENRNCIDLLLQQAGKDQGKNRCVGAYVLEENGVRTYLAKNTLLCTGGIGKVYLYTSNPDIATGDGVAMAYRAGAEIANMEFVQFHPTCLYHHQAKNFLISEAVRGEGAFLLNASGERFMQKYDPERLELATRDMVARAIDHEMKESGTDCVYLDITHRKKDFLLQRFPTIYSRCLALGIDITKDPIPVVPAAHYLCGGVLVDSSGRTTIDGLFALGETACTGLHGGNRLASNSLLEAVVYAESSYQWCKKNADTWRKIVHQPVDQWTSDKAVNLDEEVLISHNWDILRRTMWNYVGIVRNRQRLTLAHTRIIEILREVKHHYIHYHVTANMIELRNIAIIADLIIQAALHRPQSVGLHYLLDSEGAIHVATAGAKEILPYWNVFHRQPYPDYPWGSELLRKKQLKP